MTCVHCEEDTADRDTYVTYGGVIFCDWDCLAGFYVGKELNVEPETIESRATVVEQ